MLFVTADVKPVPPANVNTSPVLKVSCVELSSCNVNELAAALLKDKLPEPSVVKIWPFVPSEPGRVNVTDVVILFGALRPTKFVPLLVPSFNFKVPPVARALPIKISSIALLLSTSNADEAVKVP